MRFVLIPAVLASLCMGAACTEKPNLENEDFDPKAVYPASIREVGTPIAKMLPYFKSKDMQPFWTHDAAVVTKDARVVGNFRFTSQQNAPLARDDLNGKVYVANFFFTKCSGICPVTMPNLRTAQRAYVNAPWLRFVSYSITPELDTPAVLTDFARELGIGGGQWYLLTGPRHEIYALARDSFMADVDTGESRTLEDFIHSEQAFLIDTSHRIRGVYNLRSPTHIELLIKDISTLRASL